MNREDRKMVAIDLVTHKILKELAEEHGMQLGKLIELAVKELKSKLKIVVE